MYRIEERRFVDAPHLTPADVMTMKEAQRYLNQHLAPYGTKPVTISNLRGYLDRGALTTVVNGQTLTLKGTPRRYLLRTEVEAFAVRLANREEQEEEDEE